MLPPDLPVEVAVTLKPGHVWGVASYAQHGSPQDVDAHVPVIFYGPAFRPGRYDRFARVVDMAPTLARVLDVRPTERLDGRVLTEALR
jgi:arylsulfatase A-like enzyme